MDSSRWIYYWKKQVNAFWTVHMQEILLNGQRDMKGGGGVWPSNGGQWWCSSKSVTNVCGLGKLECLSFFWGGGKRGHGVYVNYPSCLYIYILITSMKRRGQKRGTSYLNNGGMSGGQPRHVLSLSQRKWQKWVLTASWNFPWEPCLEEQKTECPSVKLNKLMWLPIVFMS